MRRIKKGGTLPDASEAYVAIVRLDGKVVSMSGMLITVLPPTIFDFSSLILTNGAYVSFPIAQRIDTAGYESGFLQVRIHPNGSNTIDRANDSIKVVVTPHGYTPDDPGTDFGSVTPNTPTLAVVPLANSYTSPDFQVMAIGTTGFGGLLKVSVIGARGQTASGNIIAKLSIDLALKTGGDARAMAARMPGCFTGYR